MQENYTLNMQLLELLILTNMAACKEGKERIGNMFDSERYNVAMFPFKCRYVLSTTKRSVVEYF